MANTSLEKFELKVMPVPWSGCWEWIGPITAGGYGMFHDTDTKKRSLAHRFAFERYRGTKLPKRSSAMCLDHLCRNRSCVNPAHLELVSYAENLRRSPLTAAGLNAAKSHCVRGHSLDPSNVRIGEGGRRICKDCRKYFNKKQAADRKAARAVARAASI